MIAVPTVVSMIASAYPGFRLPDGISASNRLIGKSQYTVWFSRECKNGTATRILTSRYNQVEFRRPYEEAYLETKDIGEAKAQVSRLAEEGYTIYKQEVMIGITGHEEYSPATGE